MLDGSEYTYRAEIRLLNAGGRETWCLLSLSYVRAPGGATAIAHFVDIDARKRVEDALQLAHAQALEASRLKSEFVVNMSHELRTPLNGVVGLAGLLEDTALTAAQRAYVAGIRTSGQALMGVIGGILDFSKIEAGTLTIEHADFEPADVVAEVCALLAPTVREKQLDLVASVAPDVPDLARADPGRIRQILTNLVGNAVKFTDKGSIIVRASMEDGGSRQLRFDVIDAGPGIEPGARPFEAFWQADSSMTRHHGGTGLGLAIAQRMVELMDGDIRYEGVSGGGSHFWFTAPIQQPSAAFECPVDLIGVRALVVHDDESRGSILKRQLRSMGVVVTAVTDAEAAVRELESTVGEDEPYAIAVVDTVSRDPRGSAAAAAIQATPSLGSTRILLVGGTGSSGCVDDAFEVAEHLAAPFGRSRLALEVARIVAEPDKSTPTDRSSGRGRLLLAEDDAINQLFAVDLLRREGWEVEVAEDGAQAVALAVEGGYDAILMDCQMPKLDGYCATEEIRRQEGSELHTPIIAITAHATSRDRQRCLVAGMDGYVAKPFTTEQLENALRRGLATSRLPGARRRAVEGRARLAPHQGLPTVLDRGKLAHTDAAVAAKLVDLFIRTAHDRITELAAAEAVGDDERARSVAHALKGASATIGAQRMDQACDRLGKAIASGRAVDVQARQSELEAAFALTEAALCDATREAANA